MSSKNTYKYKVIQYGEANSTFSRKDIEKLLNLKSSRTRLILSELVAEDILEIIVANKNRRYKLKITKV